jgi:hypothetical protein
MTQPQIAPPTNALAIAGLVLGIVASAIGALIPHLFVAMFLAFIPGLLALIFGLVGINTANRLGGRRRKQAVWAVVLGVTPVVVWFVAAFVFAVFGVEYSIL